MLFDASSMISQIKQKKNLSELVEKLFITSWSISINYNRYFQQCSPKSCSYTYKENTNILYALTKLLSLYGGLTLTLRFIAPKIIIKVIRKRRRHDTDQSESMFREVFHKRKKKSIDYLGGILQYFRNISQRIKSILIKLNLFKTADRNDIVINQQRWTTRIYLIVLLSKSKSFF
jgi:hypothetical protein